MIYHPARGQGKPRNRMPCFTNAAFTATGDAHVVFRYHTAEGIVASVLSFGRHSPRPHGLVAID